MPKLTISTIFDRANAFQKKHVLWAYYVDPDNGLDFCEKCAHAEVSRGKAERVCVADQSADHDSPPTCYECHRWLQGFLTDYGAREELACLEEDGFNARRHQDCWLWSLCANAFLEDSDEYRRLLAVAGVESKQPISHINQPKKGS